MDENRVKLKGQKVASAGDHVVLDHVHLIGEDYSKKTLSQFCTIGCRLEDCGFEGARITDAQFGSGSEQSDFVECRFDGATIIRASGNPSRFVRCSFRNVKIGQWFARAVEFVDCVFSGTLNRAVFNSKVPEEIAARIGRQRNEIRGNDFTGADLVDVGFRSGVDLTVQYLPTGKDYLYLPDARNALQNAKLALLGWEQLELRRVALSMIGGMEREVEEGQSQILIRRSDYDGLKSMPAAAVDYVFALLKT